MMDWNLWSHEQKLILPHSSCFSQAFVTVMESLTITVVTCFFLFPANRIEKEEEAVCIKRDLRIIWILNVICVWLRSWFEQTNHEKTVLRNVFWGKTEHQSICSVICRHWYEFQWLWRWFPAFLFYPHLWERCTQVLTREIICFKVLLDKKQ
jgi:hypothetical protein